MTFFMIPDIFSFLLLCFVSVLLWRQHKQFHSIYPFSIGLAFLSIGRIADVILEISITQSPPTIGWKREIFDLLLTNIGNISDAIGSLCLVYGFIKTIQYQRQVRKRIEELEILLPLCAWCKKYKTREGDWKPIEEYLQESGAPDVTHGICPECAAKFKND